MPACQRHDVVGQRAVMQRIRDLAPEGKPRSDPAACLRIQHAEKQARDRGQRRANDHIGALADLELFGVQGSVAREVGELLRPLVVTVPLLRLAPLLPRNQPHTRRFAKLAGVAGITVPERTMGVVPLNSS